HGRHRDFNESRLSDVAGAGAGGGGRGGGWDAGVGTGSPQRPDAACLCTSDYLLLSDTQLLLPPIAGKLRLGVEGRFSNSRYYRRYSRKGRRLTSCI
ncbi:hypothetical protein J6590_105245, partial [Homalodisca vitripennis]